MEPSPTGDIASKVDADVGSASFISNKANDINNSSKLR